jgi:hypothetical protein
VVVEKKKWRGADGCFSAPIDAEGAIGGELMLGEDTQ